jgi:hypothetical protein
VDIEGQVADSSVAISPKEAVELGARSLVGFGRLFFPRTFRKPSPVFHDTVGAALYGPDRYNALKLFRNGAKTSLLRTFTMQRIAYAVSRTVMFVSVSQPHSLFSTRWLRRQIMYNHALTQTFGLRVGAKWTDEVLEIYHGVEETPITVLASGITGQVRGFNVDDYRPDLIICDDVCNEENTATPDQRKKIAERFYSALGNSLADPVEAPEAKMVLLQTPFHNEDLVETCMRDPSWNGISFGCFDEAGQSRWPERFPTAWLEEQKQAHIARGQYHLWMREWECRVVAGANRSFDVNRLRYWEVLPTNMMVVIAIDPASSESKTADQNVIMVVGFSGPDIYLLEYHAATGVMPDQAASKFFEFAYRWRPVKAACESISYQRVLAWYLEQEMTRRRTFVAMDRVEDRRRKSDRIVQAVAGPLSYGHIYVHKAHTTFITQMDDYDPQVRDQRDDMLDAFAMAITSVNVAARTIDGESYVVDESAYKPLALIGGCP